jgi:chromosome segregation ATPase
LYILYLGRGEELSRDKVSVDEPLISTDVDSLIRVIADKGIISLNELRQTSKIDKKTLDKWIAVLEDEAYIKVEYGLRGTNIRWTGEDKEAMPESVSEPPSQTKEVIEGEPEITSEPQEELFTVTEEKNEEFSAEMPIEEEPEPEELLSQYLAKKQSGSGKNLKSSILTNLGDETPKKVALPRDSDDSSEEEPEAESDDIQESEERPRVMEKIPASNVRELVSSYMKEINKEKASIESLRKDRESLYRDKFASMDGKLQSDIVVLTEKVLEKQEKIAQLKERVLELPDKVDQLSKLQDQMESLKKESRDALSRTRAKADQFVVGVQESKEVVEKKIEEVETEIEKQSDKVGELEKLNTSLDSRSAKLKTALDSAKTQVEEITSAMDSLMGDLEKVQEMKGEIDSMTDSVREIVATHGQELESLETELEGIAKVENWVQDYIRDYEDKIESIEQYVGKSEDELADLKEAAESLYMKKFLGELEDVTDSYDTELHDAIEKEQNIEEKIAASKARITDLVKESQQMIRKLKQGTSDTDEKDFGILVARVKARTERAKRTVQDKETERMKIREESAKTRKTKVPDPKAKSKKLPSKVVPKKKRK